MNSATSSTVHPWEQDVHKIYADKEAWKEGMHLEFKKSQSKLSEDLWETYSAFANTEGGIIILGVKDNGTVQGVENVPQQMKNLTACLNNAQKVSCNVSLMPDMIKEVELAGKSIIVIRVPKASPAQKPIYLDHNIFNAYFRQNEADILCSESMSQRMLRDRNVVLDATFFPDRRIIRNSRLDDLDATTLRQFRKRVEIASPDNPWLSENDETFLRMLQCYRTDRETGEEGITLAALLMFGKSESLMELLPGFQLDYFEYDGTEEDSVDRRWVDRITTDGSWTGNLFQFYFKVLPLLKAGFKRPFELDEELIRKGESPGQTAAREALANALIHADYLCEGSVRITKAPAGITLSNPGTLLVSRESLFESHDSRCRNKTLQYLFQLMGVVDKAGSGVDKIVTGLLRQCLSYPQVEERSDLPRVTWVLPYVSFIPQERLDKVAALVGASEFALMDWREKLILATMPEDEFVGNKEIRQLIPTHAADMTKFLSNLVAKGYLETSGRSSATRYKLRTGEEGSGAAASVEEPAPEVLTPFERLARDLKLSDAEIDMLRQYHTSKRNAPFVTDKVVLTICKGRWVTAAQLAILLNREPRPLRNKVIQPLHRHGKMRLRHEESTHHDQAYMTEE